MAGPVNGFRMSPGVRRTGTLLLTAACLMASPPLGGQTPPDEGPAPFRRAMDRLEAGDTTAAIKGLRATLDSDPDFGPAHFWLGALLSATSGEKETDFSRRSEAWKHLDRAAELTENDPRTLLEFGILLLKQHVQTDARRVLERAWDAAQRRSEELSPADRARFHFALGRIYERWWEDWRDRVWIPPTAEQVRCFRNNRGAYSDRAVSCPEAVTFQLSQHVPLADQRGEERARMMEHFRLALEADPGHVDAAVHLLGHLAQDDEWDEYLERARSLVELQPDSARSWLFLGLGLHERSRSDEALGAFSRALELMPDEERAVFLDITPLLTKALRAAYDSLPPAERDEARATFFRGHDPLFLTDGNERRLEHFARVAWAELMFAAPASGLKGWETDRGLVWIRYGRPARRFVIDGGGSTSIVHWLYGPRGPLFAFTKPLTYERARMTDLTHEFVEELAATAPEFYRPRSVSDVFPLPHQLARFRGDRPGLTRVEIYAQPPLDSLAVAPGAPLEAGVFVFTPDFEPVWKRKHEALVDEENGLVLTYRLQLPRGRFRYALEARLEGPPSLARPLARARGRVEAPGYPRGELAVSDLLLADDIEPRTEAPRTRAELRIRPSRTLRFERGSPVRVYFEVYGLATDDDGFGSYRAELAVEDSTRMNLVERIVSTWLPDAVRPREGEPWVSWGRTVQPLDDRSIDFLTVELPELDDGRYAVRLRLHDLTSGETAESARVFVVGAPPPEERPPLQQPPGGG